MNCQSICATNGNFEMNGSSRRAISPNRATVMKHLFRGLLVTAILISGSVAPVHAASIVVNSNDDTDDGQCDSNHCSLLEAINCANATPGPDVITFSTGATTISPTSMLPALTDDGTTIRGNGQIVLDGSLIPNSNRHGLILRSSYNKIQGLQIRHFSGDGILLDPNIDFPHADHNVIGVDGDGQNDATEGNVIYNNTYSGIYFYAKNPQLITANHNVIAGNIIGLDPTGTQAMPNSHGIAMFVYASGNRVGTNNDGISDLLERNIISGNNSQGVALPQDGISNVVQGNYIGTDITGTIGIGNKGDGVAIYFAGNNLVRGNVISANGGNGVALGSAVHNMILGNKIGTDVTGTQDLGNQFNGIRIFAMPYSPSHDNQIGFAGNYVLDFVVEPNVIAFNDWNGIWIDSHTEEHQAYDNPILYNSIFSNDLMGIDLVSSDHQGPGCTDFVTLNDPGDEDGGGNGALNFPEIDYASTDGFHTYVSATISNGLADSWFIVQFFASPSPGVYGYGEGAVYLGQAYVTTDASGNGSTGFVSLNDPTPVGYVISCTATLHDNWGPITTSEFSACVEVEQSKVILILNTWKKLKEFFDKSQDGGEMDRFVAEPLDCCLEEVGIALEKQDYKSALSLMEEFEWMILEAALAEEPLSRVDSEELLKLTKELIEELQSVEEREEEAESPQRS